MLAWVYSRVCLGMLRDTFLHSGLSTRDILHITPLTHLWQVEWLQLVLVLSLVLVLHNIMHCTEYIGWYSTPMTGWLASIVLYLYWYWVWYWYWYNTIALHDTQYIGWYSTPMTGWLASIAVMESAKRAIMPLLLKRKAWNVQLFNHYGRRRKSTGMFLQTWIEQKLNQSCTLGKASS